MTDDVSVHPLDKPLLGAGIAGLSTAAARTLAAKGIRTVRDLIEQTPRRYIDLSNTKKIGDLKIGEEATIIGKVHNVDSRYLRSRKHMLTVRINDGSGFVEAIWWNQPFRAKQFEAGALVAVAGRFERRMGKLQVTGSFFVERVAGDDTAGHDPDGTDDPGDSDDPLTASGVHTGRIIPMHPATDGVSATMMRRAIHSALKTYGKWITDPLPEEMIDRLDLMPRARAFQQIHFPANHGERGRARRRLAFEELIVLSAGLASRKRRIEREARGVALLDGKEQTQRFLDSLPFSSTGAQQRTIEEILTDIAKPVPMHRLLQGEVGSGKTVVAVAAAVAAAANGTQTALMAPTEVLAEQHYLSVKQLLDPIAEHAPQDNARGQLTLSPGGFRIELLTGSTPAAQRAKTLERARSGETHLLVGTHALIQEGVSFHRLGLAIVDEQHRFGVHQRVALRTKSVDGTQPHLLIMTATPIPRTLAMTLYGDLDVSTLDELPPGRLPITTIVVGSGERDRAETLIRDEVAQGRQAFIVCPLVEESDTLEVKAAQSEFERISAEVFPDLRVGLIHGRMRSAEKEAQMTAMRNGLVDVLVATTVIEVGVDVPNATVMMIEDADRFGLSQLHQLRGRVGRGSHAGTCVLVTSLDPGGDDEREIARRRLEAMTQTGDGFALAELDLQLRGEGQIFGRAKAPARAKTKDEAKTGAKTGAKAGKVSGGGGPAQAGATDLRFASLLRDGDLLAEARREAFRLVDADPGFKAHPELLAEVRRRFADRLDWLFAG